MLHLAGHHAGPRAEGSGGLAWRRRGWRGSAPCSRDDRRALQPGGGGNGQRQGAVARGGACLGPRSAKPCRDLSEGTRDQLYLALRTAAIEDHLAVSPALPFIGDDILQTWDEPRAVATLKAMTELSKRTQVIIMTHHEHIAALAGQLPSGTIHVTRLS